MAKAAWLTVSPASGSGNATISNTATAHTGRLSRSTEISVQGVGVTDPVVCSVVQSPILEFVSLDDGDNVAVGKTGGNLTISGTTNSESLTFALGSGDLGISLPSSYLANGESTNNGADIDDDPGADATFAFSVVIAVPANTGVSSLTKVMTVTAEGGQAQQITITQAAGEASLTLSTSSITLNSDGDAVAITVTSNTTWTVS